MADPTNSLVLSQLTASGVAVGAIQVLKKILPDFPEQWSGKIYGFIGAVASLFVAFGLHITYVKATGDLTIHGLTLANLFWGASHWLRSFLSQEGEYRIYKVSNYLPKVYAAIQAMQQATPPAAPPAVKP